VAQAVVVIIGHPEMNLQEGRSRSDTNRFDSIGAKTFRESHQIKNVAKHEELTMVDREDQGLLKLCAHIPFCERSVSLTNKYNHNSQLWWSPWNSRGFRLEGRTVTVPYAVAVYSNGRHILLVVGTRDLSLGKYTRGQIKYI
jgi:hypothetical protein